MFSTNAFPFEGPANGRTCSSYSKFAAYAVLNHSGDYSAAAKDLSAKGYGDQPKPKSSPAKPAPKLILSEPFRPFPVETLPEPLRTLVDAGAKSIGCDTSFIALPLLTVVAAAIGNSRRLLAKRGWTVPPILWTAIVGESGTAKTPAFKLAVKAMRERQRKALQRQDEEEKRYADELAVYEKQYSAWKQNKKSAEEPPKKPEPPLAERCLVSDTTVEALAPILKANPRGLLLARDELNGWLGSFDRYAGGKGGADASHWLSMHNGETIIVDRRTGQPRTIFVPQASICVTGGIQPGILDKALGREHRESGLCARLLLACPPRKAKRWTEDEIDPQHEDSIARLVDWLYDLRPVIDDDGQVRPVVIGMTKDAREAWKGFYGAHAEEMADLSGEMAAAFNKLEEAACRLALVVHYARWAAGDESLTHDGPLDRQSMVAGVTLCQWFKAETARVYGILEESPESREQRRLIEWIERKGGQVTARELAHGPRSYRGQPEMAEAALNELVHAGVGTWDLLPPTELGGRPTRLFRLISAAPGPETPTDSTDCEGFGSGASSREVKNEAPDDEQGDGIALLSQARDAGLKVVVQNGCLRIRGPRKSAALSQLLISNKAAVVAALESNTSVDLGPDLQQLDSGPGTETPENPASEEVSGPASLPSPSYGGGHFSVDRSAQRHRLIGNNYPPRISEQPAAAIRATPAEICPRCNRGRVLRELRQMTGGKCWSCWEAEQNAKS